MPRTKNPFYTGSGYNDPSMAAIGSNIGAILLGGETPNAAAERESKEELRKRQGLYYEANTDKARQEAEKLRARNAAQTDEGFTRSAKAKLGYHPDTPDDQIDPAHMREINKFRGQLFTQRSLTGPTNFQQFQQGITEDRDRTMGDIVAGGGMDAGRAAQAVGVSKGNAMRSVEDGVNISRYLRPEDSPMVTTAPGQARINASESTVRKNDSGIRVDGARINSLNASAESSRASANKARRETTVENYIGDDANGNPRYRLDPRAVGGTVTKPKGGANGRTNDVSPAETIKLQDLIMSSVGNAKIDEVEPEALQAATAAATKVYQQTGDAGRAAREGAAMLQKETTGIPGFRSNRYKLRQGGASAPATAPAGASAEQRKSLNGKSYVKINGQWYEE